MIVVNQRLIMLLFFPISVRILLYSFMRYHVPLPNRCFFHFSGESFAPIPVFARAHAKWFGEYLQGINEITPIHLVKDSP